MKRNEIKTKLMKPKNKAATDLGQLYEHLVRVIKNKPNLI
jgi:hypothetical protein